MSRIMVLLVKFYRFVAHKIFHKRPSCIFTPTCSEYAMEAFEKYGISFEHMPSGVDTMSVIVHQSEFEEKEQKVLTEIKHLVHPDVLDLEPDIALIAIVGRGMREARGTAGRIFSALAHAKVNVKMIDQGSSEINIIVGVKNSEFETAIKAIYDIFVLTQM